MDEHGDQTYDEEIANRIEAKYRWKKKKDIRTYSRTLLKRKLTNILFELLPKTFNGIQIR